MSQHYHKNQTETAQLAFLPLLLNPQSQYLGVKNFFFWPRTHVEEKDRKAWLLSSRSLLAESHWVLAHHFPSLSMVSSNGYGLQSPQGHISGDEQREKGKENCSSNLWTATAEGGHKNPLSSPSSQLKFTKPGPILHASGAPHPPKLWCR